jgi:tetratricopeptide (TPR) repeat protein
MILAALERILPLALMASLAAASGSAPAERLERWRWNSWERTRHGIEQLREGDAPAAAAALDTAARVSDHDPRALLNAGAAHLLAGDPTGAVPWLEQAAALAPAPLAASAQYHLGTARLAAGTASPASGTPSQPSAQSQQNIAGAIEALQEALRLQPDFSAAKHNLELALRAQERQKQQQEKQQEKQQEQPSQRSRTNEQTPGNDGRPAAETTPRPGQTDSQPSDSPDNKPQDNRPDQGEGGGRDQAPPAAAGERSLTPEQVRSLLAAVENLERQQRRQQGQQKLSRAASVEKDW